ncbi:MAG TPA: TerB family tellurite resistance protein [Candidatus Eremiobacteraeota bacterium]|nr:MAG: Tellurite resistance protein TerB [bacterium ADurb.Bin363]HPZ06532.1 TerB family tellurite resistance protein [Candidatus Eremiobacteraeota bacterium]
MKENKKSSVDLRKYSDKHPIFAYPKEVQRNYIFIISLMAAVDGVISLEEQDYIGKLCDLCKLSISEKEALMEKIRCHSGDFIEMLQPFCSSDIRFTMVWELLIMEYADGVLMEEEIVYLKKITDTLQISQKQYDLLIKLIETGLKEGSYANLERKFRKELKEASIPIEYLVF